MTELLENLSNALAETVEALSPSTVRVEARRRMPATGIVWSADGVIVTSHHVVERDEEIKIGLADGTVTDATLVGRDPNSDTAVLRISTSGLAAPQWADLDDLQVGHLVLALGRPGHQMQATLGIVSALAGGSSVGYGRRRGRGTQLEHYIKTDVVMYPGFSGGPLVDAAGKVRGFNTSVMSGTSLAIPTPIIRNVVETLLAHGKMRRGYLGITSQPVALPANLKEKLEQETALLVIAVEPGSPADKGGLVLGDTVIALDTQTVANMDDLMILLNGERVGKTVTVQIVRGGTIIELQVTIGERS